VGKIKEFLKGKKTYIIAVAAIIAVLPEWAELSAEMGLFAAVSNVNGG
jgi:hypothetical protein